MKPHSYRDGGFVFEMADLVGKTFTKVTGGPDDDEMRFECTEGVFVFHHEQDCCESVSINDVTGDLSDLVGTPLLKAEECESCPLPEGYVPDEYGSETWTFYKFATIKGYVDVRWLGSSNGYYSEHVNLKFEPATNVEGA